MKGQIGKFLYGNLWPNEDRADIWHFCPACKQPHSFRIGNFPPETPHWEFDFNIEKPTFTPSMRCLKSDPEDQNKRITTCHYTITAGRIYFHPDSPHELKGQYVDLPLWDLGW